MIDPNFLILEHQYRSVVGIIRQLNHSKIYVAICFKEKKKEKKNNFLAQIFNQKD